MEFTGFMWTILASLLFQAHGFSTGPPTTICLTEFPSHGHQKQTTSAPFRIIVSPATYIPSQTVTVSLEGVNNQFKGVLVSAHRKSGNTEELLGSFSTTIDKMQTLNCTGGLNNAAGHKNNNSVSSVDVEWKAPVNYGDVQFRATFVEKLETFWTGVTADLKAANEINIKNSTYDLPAIASSFTAINWTACGESRGCFYHPSTCNGSDCTAALTYKANGDGSFTFEMEAKTDGYVAMALSKDKIMGGDESVVCMANNIKYGFNGYNEQFKVKYHVRLETKMLSGVQVQAADGRVRCRFTRPKITSFNVHGGDMTFNRDEPYHIHLAWGKPYIGTDVIAKHVEAPAITDSQVDLTKHDIHTVTMPPTSSTPTEPSSPSSTGQLLPSLTLLIFVYIFSRYL